MFHLAAKYSFAITTVTVFELWKEDNSEEDAFWEKLFSRLTIPGLDMESAKIADKDFPDLGKKGQMIDIEDLLIGAIAKKNNLKVATQNTRHFSRIAGLSLIDLSTLP